MKKIRVNLNPINAEKMWNFAQVNRVHIHFIESLIQIDNFNQSIYVYELLMTPETYTAFALSVPVVSV